MVEKIRFEEFERILPVVNLVFDRRQSVIKCRDSVGRFSLFVGSLLPDTAYSRNGLQEVIGDVEGVTIDYVASTLKNRMQKLEGGITLRNLATKLDLQVVDSQNPWELISAYTLDVSQQVELLKRLRIEQ